MSRRARAKIWAVVFASGLAACPTSVDRGAKRDAGGLPASRDAGGDRNQSDPDAGAELPGEAGCPLPCGDPAADPASPGPFAVTVLEDGFDVDSGASGRRVELTVYRPDAEAPAPVVVLLHGFQLPASLYASYGEHLASRGFVAVLPDLPGGLLGGPTHAELAAYLGEVLDWIEAESGDGGALEGAADPARLGLGGHSLGGKISLLLAADDPRARAVFAIDPVDAAKGPLSSEGEDYPSVTPERMGDVTVPLVLLGETVNASCEGLFCQPCAPADESFRQYYEHATSPALEIEVVGASHMSFVDDPACGLACSVCAPGSDDPEVSRALTRRYLTAFFELLLKGDEDARAWLVGERMAEDVATGLVVVRSKNGL